MGNELVATYLYGEKVFAVYGCWDKDTPENCYDFYDVYYKGICLNLGDPYDEMPTRADVLALASEQELI